MKMIRKKLLVGVMALCCMATSVAAVSTQAILSKATTTDTATPVSLFSADKGVTLTGETATPNYVTSDIRTGVGVSVGTGRLNVEFDNIIDLNKIDKDTPLIEWIPNPKERGVDEIVKITVTITDADDDSNYIALAYSYTGHYGTFIRARNGKLRETEVATKYYTNWGQNLANYRETANWEESTINPYSIIYSPTSNKISTLSNGNVTEMFNLNDETWFGVGKTFDGFKNNRVKISICANTIAGSQADYLILSVGGMSLAGGELVDTEDPSILITPPETIPMAEVNKPYELFSANAYDLIDGNLDYTISVAEPESDVFIKQTGTSFVPNKEGIYTLRYETADKSGHDTYEDFHINVYERLALLDIEIDEMEKTEFNLGETVKIPNYTVKGGSGVNNSSIRVISLDTGKEIAIENGTVIASITGKIKIEYTAEDYLKDKVTKATIFTVKSENLPVLNATINAPIKLFDGVPTQMPMVNALDYDTYKGVEINADCRVIACGTGDKASVENIIYDSKENNGIFNFMPNKNVYGNSVILKYQYKCLNLSEYVTGNYLEKEFTVVIEDKPTYLTEYFAYNANNFSVEHGIVEEKTEDGTVKYKAEGGIVITNTNDSFATDEDKIFTFANILGSEDSLISFNFPFAGQKFNGFKIRFYDSNDKNIGFEILLRKPSGVYDNTTTVIYNDKNYIMAGGFELENSDYGTIGKTPQVIKFSNNALYDYKDTKICDITNNMNDTPFEGFPSQKMRVEFEFVDAEEGACVQLIKLNNQVLDGNFSTDRDGNILYNQDGTPILNAFDDMVKPLISCNYPLNQKYEIGQRVSVPMAYASDEITSATFTDGKLSSFVIYVSIRKPLGGTVEGFNNVLLKEGMSFEIQEYGNYTITYTARDYKGLKGEKSINIIVEDTTPPIISLSSYKELQGKVNKDIQLTKFTVQDNATISEELITHIYLVKPNGIMEVVDKETLKVKVTEAGDYKVIYYARDAYDNETIEILKLKVER